MRAAAAPTTLPCSNYKPKQLLQRMHLQFLVLLVQTHQKLLICIPRSATYARLSNNCSLPANALINKHPLTNLLASPSPLPTFINVMAPTS